MPLTQGKGVSGRRNSNGRGSEASTSTAYPRNKVIWAGARLREMMLEEWEGPEDEDLESHIQEFGFTLRVVRSVEVIVARVSCGWIRLLCEE